LVPTVSLIPFMIPPTLISDPESSIPKRIILLAYKAVPPVILIPFI
jgi:hypothetical protein